MQSIKHNNGTFVVCPVLAEKKIVQPVVENLFLSTEARVPCTTLN